MRKFVLYTVLAAILAAVVLQLLDISAPYYWANKGLVAKMKYWKRSDTDFNALFVGSSRTQMHLSPKVFDNITGTTKTLNLGYGSTYAEEALHFTEKLLKSDMSNDLEYIFFEIRPIWFNADNLFTSRGKYILDYKEYQFLSNYYSKTDKQFAPLDYRLAFMENFLKIGVARDLLQYHLYDRFSSADDFLIGPDNDGFLNRKQAIAEDEQNKLLDEAGKDRAQTEADLNKRIDFALECYADPYKLEKADKLYVSRLNDLIKACEEKGIEVYFYPSIRFENTNVPGIINNLNAEPIWVGTANPDLYPELFDINLSGDVSHLSPEGAVIYSEIMAEIFREFKQGSE